MRGRGDRIFADAVLAGARAAAEPARSRLIAHARAVSAPLPLVIRGRPGVGRHTVAAALRAVGLAAEVGCADTHADTRADTRTGAGGLDVLVLAEVPKPEDLAGPRPTLAVLAKADLAGLRPDGPMAAARRRAGQASALLGVPVIPLAGPAAVAGCDDSVLDADLLDALRVFVDEPADLGSPDAFVSCPHRVPAALRRLLLATLDVFGIAESVVALRTEPGAGAEVVRRRLRAVSGIDAVVGRIEAAGAEARYRRVLQAVAGIEELAAAATGVTGAASARAAAELLCDRDLVLGRMASATEVVRAAGFVMDPVMDPGAHVRRAVRWRRDAAGPVSALHQACGSDIARGSLHLAAAAEAERR